MRNPVLVGLSLTLIYCIGAAVYLYLQYQPVQPAAFWDYLRQTGSLPANPDYIERYNLNGLGDFLAGFFAPLAFLWLVVTVILQMHEMGATRAEMKEQKEAMQAQVAEAKANKIFVEEQTNIMKRQAELAAITYAKDRKLQLFDRRMDVYEELKAFTNRPFYELVSDKENREFIHLYNKVMFLFAEDANLLSWMLDIKTVSQKVLDDGDFNEIEREWDARTDPDVFHMAFAKHLTIYE